MGVMSRILHGLYVGAEDDSIDTGQLKEHKVTHIVRIDDYDPKQTAREANIDYHFLQFHDSVHVEICQYFSAINDFVHEARMKGGVVLIHCAFGISRSVTVTTAYILSITELDLPDVQLLIRMARSQAKPNQGFQKQLEMFVKEDLQKERVRMRKKFDRDHLYARHRLAKMGHHVRIIDGLIVVTRDQDNVPIELEDSSHGITHVVRIGTSRHDLPTKPSFVYHFVELRSESPVDFDLSQHLPGVNEFIHKARTNRKDSKVLINCTSGSLASGLALTIGHLLSTQTEFSLDQLIELVKKAHGGRNINEEDMKPLDEKLKEFQSSYFHGLEDERKRLKGMFTTKEDADRRHHDRELIVGRLNQQ